MTYNGFVNNEDASVLTGSLAYAYAYDQYENIGTYDITVSGFGSNNYAITYVKGTMTVAPKAVTATLTVTNVTYGAEVTVGASFDAGMIVNNDDVPILLTYSGTKHNGSAYALTETKPSEAGTYTMWANLSDSGKSVNYSMALSADFVIAQKALTIKANDMTITYGDEPANNGVTFSGFVAGENATVLSGSAAYSYSYVQYGDVGEYVITPSGFDSNNYSITYPTGTLVVVQKVVGLAWGTTAFTYGREEYCPTATATGLVNNDECIVTVTGGQLNAGSYTATAVDLSSDNYKLPAATTTSFTISPKTVEFEWTAPEDLIYDNTAKEPSVVIGNICAGDEYWVMASLTSGKNNVNAGTFTFTVTAIGNANYVLPDAAYRVSPEYTIEPKDIATATITLGSALTYNGTTQTQTVTSVVVDGLTATFTPSDNTGKNAGNYTLTVTGYGNFTGSATKGFSIAKKDLTIYANDHAITYGDAPANNGVSYNGFVAQEDENVLTGSAAYTYSYTQYGNVGSYDINVTGFGSDNYAIEYETGVLTVGKKELTVTANDRTITYGDEPANSGVAYSGFVGSDNENVLGGNWDYAYAYTQYGDVGSYGITVSGLTATNYEFAYVAGTLTVDRYEVVISWSETTLRYTGSEQNPTASASVLNGDDYELTLSEGNVTVGSYTATVLTITNGNYVLPTTGLTCGYTILPAYVTAPTPMDRYYSYTGEVLTFEFVSFDSSLYTANNNTRIVGGSQTVYVVLNDKDNYYWTDETTDDLEFVFTVGKLTMAPPTIANKSYTGQLVTADVEESEYYFVAENVGGVHIGEYTVTLTLEASHAEYLEWEGTSDASIVCTYSIVQATNVWVEEPVIPIIAYGETLPDPTAISAFGTASFLYRAQSATDDDYSAQKPTNAGNYYVLMHVDGTENYTALTDRREFTIEKATLDGSALAWVYDGAFTYDGMVKSVSITGVPAEAEAVVTNNEKIHAGSYTASVQFVYDEANYNTFTFGDLVWTIDPMIVEVVWEEQAFIFNGVERTIPGAFYEDVTGNHVALTVAEANGKIYLASGEYLFVATDDDTDYAIAGEEMRYEIAKKKVAKPTEDTTDFICTGAEQTYGITSNGDYTVDNNVRTDEGSQTVTVRLNDAINCTWQDETTSDLTFTFTIRHQFSAHNGDEELLKTPATCLEKAVYYAVCACGEREEYEYGDPLGHDYVVTFTWTKDFVPTAHIACSRCDFEDECDCELTIEPEGNFEHCNATIVYNGKVYTDSKVRGACIYEGRMYTYPTWTWAENDDYYAYTAKASFVTIEGEQLVHDVNAEMEFTDEERRLIITATVRFGDDEEVFTDHIVVDKYLFIVKWTEQNVVSSYVLPRTKAGDVLGEIPDDDRTLYAFVNSEGVHLSYANDTLLTYHIVKNDTIMALWLSKGTVTITVVDEEGNPMADVSLELSDASNLYERSTTQERNSVSFRNVTYGLYQLKASFSLAGKQIDRVFSVDVNAENVTKEIVLVKEKVNTEVIGETICDNLDKVVEKKTDTAISVTVTLDTTKAVDSAVVEKLQKAASEEKYNQELHDFRSLTVTETIKTTDEDGKVIPETREVTSTQANVTVKVELDDVVFGQLVARAGTLDDIVVYLYDQNKEEVIKLPKQEFAHESTQYYSVVTTDTKPYVMLSVNTFGGAFSIGIRNKIVQAVNQLFSASIRNWVYGNAASTPISNAKYGTVKYAYAKKGTDTFTSTVPKNAGTYYMKAYVEAEEEYTGVEEIVEFTIEKATYNMKVSFSDRTVIYDGSQYSLEIHGDLPEGVSVVYEQNVGSNMGEYTAIAHFYGDSDNYNLIPDKTATLVIEDKTMWLLKTYWWAFAAAGAFVLFLIVVLIVRARGGRGGRGFGFDYRIGR